MKIQNVIIYLFFLLSLGACAEKLNISSVLSDAENLMVEQPDSALFLLEGIKLPEKSSSEQYALWCLLLTQARDKNYIQHASDSLITFAVNYFDKKDDISRKAQSYYCRGRVFMDMLLFDEAIADFFKAEEFVSQIRDYNLHARICNQLGDVFRRNSLYKESLSYYQKAHSFYKLEESLVGMAYTLRDIGLAYQNLGQLDSSAFYFNNSLRVAKEHSFDKLEYSVLACLGSVYESMSLYSTAIDYIYRSMEINQQESLLYSSYYTLGCLYRRIDQIDSAYYYLQSAVGSSDINIQCQSYRELALLLYKKKRISPCFSV